MIDIKMIAVMLAITVSVVAVVLLFYIMMAVLFYTAACVLVIFVTTIEDIWRKIQSRQHKKKGFSNGREHNEN